MTFSLTEYQTMSSITTRYTVSINTVIRRLFFHAKSVTDNFHLVQMTLHSLNQTRIQLTKQLKDCTREYCLLKHYWRLYLIDDAHL